MLKKILLFLYFALILTLATATGVEYFIGTEWVMDEVYHSLPFCALWAVLALSMLYLMWRRKMWRQCSLLLLHLSFVVILLGACLTFLTSQKGFLHLRVGETCREFLEQEHRKAELLPFSLRLEEFQIKCYPGTEAPQDYVSRLSCLTSDGDVREVTISMNRVFDHLGYRFYQSSYDEDMLGTVLSVNYDPWGTSVTYIGYLLLLVSMIAVLLHRRGEFCRLLRHPLLRSGALTLLLLFSVAGESLSAQSEKPLPYVSRTVADSLSARQVIYHDRVSPYNTLARDFVRKLSGQDSFGGLSAEQIVESWRRYPEEWSYVPIIKIKSERLRERLNLQTSHARLIDLFEGDKYLLREWWLEEQRHELNMQEGEHKHSLNPKKISNKPSAMAKAILETDEKVSLILMLHQGTLIRYIETEDMVVPLSDVRIRAELLYNKIPFCKLLFMFCLTLGFLSFGCYLCRSLGVGRLSFKGFYRVANRTFYFLLVLAWLFHLFGFLLRWYIGGRVPLSNGYETMLFLALCLLSGACWGGYRFSPLVVFGFLLSGFTLLVAYLGEMNPQITPLMPVLLSPWLSIHVSLIMISYALFAFILMNGVLGLLLRREAERLMVLSRVLLYPAVFFLGIGIFVGAVWANVSWGRYWAWDPKEVWALITFMIYGAAFHAGSIKCFSRPRFFHLYMVFSFLSVLMTYFGVNYLLGGMHGYA